MESHALARRIGAGHRACSLLLACVLVAIDGAGVLAAELPPTPPSNARVRELIASLKLEYLPGESGYFGFLGRSDQKVTVDGRVLAAQSRIHYLLTSDLPVNYLHWLASEDTHVLIEGGPVDYFIFHSDGRAEQVTLGRDASAGQRLVVTAPAGSWKALRLRPGATHVLLANVLSPEWTQDRVKIGAGEEWVRKYRGAAPWATAATLRDLIGPNFRR